MPALLALLAAPAPWSTLALAGLIAVPLLVRAARVYRGREPASGRAAAVALGRDRAGRVVAIEDRQLAAHGLILGASGSGKSTTLLRVLSDRIARGLPVVVIDLKGSSTFASSVAGAAAAAGRRCVIWSLDGGAHWNPLAHGNATELKDKLIATERFTEPHYRRAAERYLQTALTVLSAHHPGRAPTLAEVVAMCEPRRLVAAARGLPDPLRERVSDYVTGLGPDQVSAVRGLGTRLAIVTESHLGAWLAPGAGPELDLRAALRGEAVAVLSLNSSRYGSLAAQLGTMAVQDLVSAAGERLTAGAPGALVAIDEFSALGADQVLALFARGREAGLSVLLATQELSDLDRAAHGLRDQVLGNTALKIIHRLDVPASAHAAAQMIGTEPVWVQTRQFGGPLGPPRGTRREVDRFRIHPDAIASLPTGTAVVITKVPRSEVRVVQVTPGAVPARRPAVAPGRPGVAAPAPVRPPLPELPAPADATRPARSALPAPGRAAPQRAAPGRATPRPRGRGGPERG